MINYFVHVSLLFFAQTGTNIHVNITHYYYNVSIFMVQMFSYRCQLYILIDGMMESMF